jgi:hypothetical protein
MALKNYTSKVPVSRSISFIESKLVANGARSIMKEYGPEGEISTLCFVINISSRDIPFRLPAKVQECERVLLASLSSRARPETRKKMKAQAERTAWKILSDWVEAQMAMIELAQVDVMEVFLPYVYDPATQQTFFQTLKDRKFKGLLTGPK